MAAFVTATGPYSFENGRAALAIAAILYAAALLWLTWQTARMAELGELRH